MLGTPISALRSFQAGGGAREVDSHDNFLCLHVPHWRYVSTGPEEVILKRAFECEVGIGG